MTDDLCLVCESPIDGRGFFNVFRGNECRLFCKHACAVKETEEWATLAERERCARLAENFHWTGTAPSSYDAVQMEIGRLIRSGKEADRGN